MLTCESSGDAFFYRGDKKRTVYLAGLRVSEGTRFALSEPASSMRRRPDFRPSAGCATLAELLRALSWQAHLQSDHSRS